MKLFVKRSVKVKQYSKLVKVENNEKFSTIIINNHAKRNPLCSQMIQDLSESFDSLDSVKLVVLKSTGNVYCSGYNLKELSDFTKQQQNSYFQSSFDLFEKIKKLKQPGERFVEIFMISYCSNRWSSCSSRYSFSIFL
jgi:enoyl-CoA hydratase/carnithine racemase